MKKLDLGVLLISILCIGLGSGTLNVSINPDNFGSCLVAIISLVASFWLVLSREYKQN